MNKNELFTDEDEGTFTLISNHFWEQQSRGLLGKPHSYLSKQDLVEVLDHNIYTPDRGTGYLNRLFFNISIMIGERSKELFQITIY